MATLLVDGFSHYGTGTAANATMLEGAWAALGALTKPAIPTWAVQDEGYWLSESGGVVNRLVLPASGVGPFYVAMSFGATSLPSTSNVRVIDFRDSSNRIMAALVLLSTGSLELINGDGTVLVSTSGPVVVASTRYHLEMSYTKAGAFELRVNAVSPSAISATGLAVGQTIVGVLTSNDIAQLGFLYVVGSGDTAPLYMKDLVVRDGTGTLNNGFEGDLKVATLFPAADTSTAGWTPEPRKKIGNGYLTIPTTASNNAGVTAVNAAALQLGAGDFTLESFVRFAALPASGHKAAILGMWNEGGNERSYQFYLDGTTGDLSFRISTDGLAGTVNTIVAYPWVPDTDTWYHVAIVRASAELLLFVNGIQLGLPIADTNTYFASTARLALGLQFDTSYVNNTSVGAWYDETRMTVGYARYTAPFTAPTAAFPRGSGSDAQWSYVALLAGYDSSLVDESSYARALTAYNSAVQTTADDGTYSYQTINQATPRDDTMMEAALIPATDILTTTANFSASDTVTVGTKDGSTAAVYTFKTALAAAFDVLIGATAQASVNNFIAAINAAAGSGTTYGTGTTANYDVNATQLPSAEMLVSANTAGTAGNSIAATSTATGATWAAATLLGGVNIPGPSNFTLQRLPIGTTVVKSLTLVTRNYKTDAGTCTDTHGFVGSLGTVSSGAAVPLPTSPAYHADTFETDPETSGALSPVSIISGKVQLNRTA